MNSEVIHIVQLQLPSCPVPFASLQLGRSCTNMEEEEEDGVGTEPAEVHSLL